MNRQEIFELVRKYNRGQCTPEEESLLETWYVSKNDLYHTELSEAEISSALNDVYSSLPKPARKVKLWPRIAVAAAIIIAVFCIWFFKSGRPASESTVISYANDIAPGKNKATLTLAKGKTIQLSELKKGLVVGNDLRYDDHTAVIADGANGKRADLPGATEMTLSTPRGGLIRLPYLMGQKYGLMLLQV